MIHNLVSLSRLSWCILGDFNDLMYVADKKGNVPHPQSLLNDFCSTIEECHLSELDLNGGSFTWEKSRGSKNWVREKLDKAFATQSWWCRFPLCKFKDIQVSCSNHNSIQLEFL